MQTPSHVPLSEIAPSKSNPRGKLKAADLSELIESIRRVGVLQPVLVRPRVEESGRQSYELVYGHRRLAAAREAGLQEIPVTIRILTDAEVLEIQIVENLQRADVHPLEEADAYDQLTRKHGHTVDEVAARVGKSRAYVYARMKLCALDGNARAAFLENRIDASTALLLARIPHTAIREKATKLVLEGGRFNDDEPLSYRRAAEMIRDEFMLQLGKAPFDPADAELLPTAGPCGACPKRTGNQPELFGDVKDADVCTDPGCYRAKCDAFWVQAKANASRSGIKIISEADSKRLFPYAHYNEPNTGMGFVAPASIYRDSRCKAHGTYAKLCRGQKPQVFLARNPHDGKLHKLWKQSEALALARKVGTLKKDAKAESKAKKGPWSPPPWELQPLACELARKAAIAKLEKSGSESFEPALRTVASVLMPDGGDEAAISRGWIEEKKLSRYGSKKLAAELKNRVAKLKGRSLLAFVGELAFHALAQEEPMCEALGFKFSDFVKQAREQLVAERSKRLASKKASTSAPSTKGAKKSKSAKKSKPGECSGCGCTDDNPCETEEGEPCSWTDEAHTWCSACEKDAKALKELNDREDADLGGEGDDDELEEGADE